MKIEYFTYIVEVAKKGSISKAAESLFVSQPYLSRIIKEVEAELNVNLFHRMNTGILPTKTGELFIEKAQIMLKQFESLTNMDFEVQEPKSVVRISSVRSSLIMEAFIQLTEELSDQQYEFHLRELESNAPVNDVYYMQADIGVIYQLEEDKLFLLEELSEKGIKYEKICKFDMCYILGVSHPILKGNHPFTWKDLLPYGLVTYPISSLPYHSNNKMLRITNDILSDKSLNKVVYVNSRAAYHNMLTQSNFFAIGTQSAKGQEERFNITSIPIEDEKYAHEMEMGILYREDQELNEAANRFIKILKENYKDRE